jgi:TPR repeat protein
MKNTFNIKDDKYKTKTYKFKINKYINKNNDEFILLVLVLYNQYILYNYNNINLYYNILIDKYNNSDAMIYLANYYNNICKNKTEAFKYLDMAVKLNNSYAMVFIGDLYEENNNETLMLKYYKLSLELNNILSMYRLAIYYQNNNNIEEMNKHFILGIKLGDIDSMEELSLYYYNDNKNILKLYTLLNNIDEKNDLINKNLNNLKKHYLVNIYYNKINFAKENNYIKYCPICMNEKLCVLYNCMHHICIDCYIEVPKCYYNCDK